jgi:predicted flap endonuclease-1-like 5' DNA nuclease
MARIVDIEGIGEVWAARLQGMGIVTTEALLKRGATPEGRQALAEEMGASPNAILDWVNRADLFRVKGVGEEYSDLLEIAGVDTVPELAQRNPTNLHAALVEANAQKKLVRRLPGQAEVVRWVEEAKALPRVITY